jgi:zinc protease
MSIRPWLFAAAALACVCANAQHEPGKASQPRRTTATSAAGSDLLPFRAAEKTLPNGLKVIVVRTGFPNIVSLQIPVQTGSRNEVEAGRSGFAHFFEHMMFRGTKAYPPERYQQIIARAGARQNAFTTDDFTNYHTTFAKEDLETVLKVEADRFQHLSYSQEAFKTESRAVLGEYNKNSADPNVKLAEVVRDSAYRVHTYKHTTMGFLRDIEDMPNQYEYSRIFFDRWYRPNNTAIIIAGDVDEHTAFALVEKYWAGWKRGSYAAAIPAEPPPQGPIYVHVPWSSATLPLVSISFHGPAFSEKVKDYAALKTLLSLSFGPTSDLYKRLVEDEQKVDELVDIEPGRVDPPLVTIRARIKKIDDAVYVRDQILRTIAQIRSVPVSDKRLADAKSSQRYGLLRTLDNTEQIAGTLAQYVRYHRAYSTLNEYYRLVDTLTPADLSAAARTYLSDAGLVVATLSKDDMPAGIDRPAALDTFTSEAAAIPDLPALVQKSSLPQICFKLLFPVGSASDPQGKEGLAALTAAMVARAGSRQQKFDEISRALFPLAGGFSEQVDKEMTTFTGTIHRDNWNKFIEIALPMLVSPGFREEDFQRLRDAQRNELLVDLKGNNEEELAKERLQTNVFAGTPFGHPVLGTAHGIDSIALDDVKDFWAKAYTQGALRIALAGDVSDEQVATLKRALGQLAAGPGLPASAAVVGRKPNGVEVEIIQKETRATAISLGYPIEVTRSHPDYAALWIAKTWLGEHRSSTSHLYQRIREIRGMNYGDYAYIEAFPRGMFQFFPDPNLGRRAQLFEIWIRPVLPDNAHMALRIAVYELGHLIEYGLTEQQFQTTRDYLMKNVFLMTATQNQQVGYALDSQWYGVPEYTKMMRDALAKLTRDDVNWAIRKHLAARDLSVVIVTKDAAGLKDALLADGFSPIRYDAPKPQSLLDEDQRIGRLRLGLRPDAVAITPVGQVFE